MAGHLRDSVPLREIPFTQTVSEVSLAEFAPAKAGVPLREIVVRKEAGGGERGAKQSTLCPDANAKPVRIMVMKIALLMGAAALVMCAGSAAVAKTVSISFDGLCDGMDIIVDKTARTALETGNGCDEGAHFGAGTIGRIKGRGNAITFGVNLSAKGGDAYQYIYVISYPLVTGASWSNFYTTDGKTLSREFTGTYTVTGAAPHKTGGLRSSTDRPR